MARLRRASSQTRDQASRRVLLSAHGLGLSNPSSFATFGPISFVKKRLVGIRLPAGEIPERTEERMLCQEIMKLGVECLSPSSTAQRAAQKMRDLNIGFLPVCDPARKVLGTVTD